MGKLDGKIAIVTGAGRGIGRAIAEAYLQEGASVTITAARGQAELDHFVQQGRSEQVLPLLADVTDPQACEQVVDQTIQRFGQIDILVNNAGCGIKTASSGFWDIEPSSWHMVIETNVNGPFYMARAVVTHMMGQQRQGSIINISTTHETMKRRSFSPYGPSKAALSLLLLYGHMILPLLVFVSTFCCRVARPTPGCSLLVLPKMCGQVCSTRNHESSCCVSRLR